MDMSKYSQEAVEMIKSANKIAIRNNNSEVTDLHLLYAILLEDEKLIVDFLEESSVNLQKLKEDCENAIKKLKSLKGRVVFALDITALLAGAKYRGDFEDRLKKILEIVRDSEGKIILFIDEIHNIIGTGSSSGAMDTANILKPMLARGEILTIGATTIEEYKKYIEKDGALDRRFQKILVEEASVDTSIAILRGIKSKYEKHHRVKILDNALVDAVKLSKRFLSYRKLPDVAIDVMDEAAALTRMAKDQKPEEIDELNRKLVQLEMEKIAIKEQGDKLSEKRILEKEEQIQKLKESLSKKTELYELEKDRQEQILINEKELESIESEIELIKDEHRIEELDEKIESKKIVDKKITELNDKEAYYPLNSEVTSDEVKDIVSKLSGMPKVKLQLNKLENLDTIRDKLKMEFVGYDYMVDKIIDTYLISESALFDRNKPIGSFLVTGKVLVKIT